MGQKKSAIHKWVPLLAQQHKAPYSMPMCCLSWSNTVFIVDFCQESMCLLQDLNVAVSCVVLLWRPAIFAMSLREASQETTSALGLQSCCSIGRRHASRWKAALHVALNAPQMILTALAVEKEMFDPYLIIALKILHILLYHHQILTYNL